MANFASSRLCMSDYLITNNLELQGMLHINIIGHQNVQIPISANCTRLQVFEFRYELVNICIKFICEYGMIIGVNCRDLHTPGLLRTETESYYLHMCYLLI